MPTDTNYITEIVVGALVGLSGLAIGLQKLVKGWKETSAESSVISIVHSELERLAEQNKFLTAEINRLQVEVITLNKQLKDLIIENQQLNQEIAGLTKEVNRLQTMLSVYKREDLNDFTS